MTSQRALDLKFRNDTQELTKLKIQKNLIDFSKYLKAIFVFRASLLMLLLLFASIALYGQNRKDLEAKRKQLLQEIQETNELLDATKRNKETTLDRYFALQSQIRKRQQLINNLNEEIVFTDASIERTNQVIEALNEDVERLNQEYAAMLRVAYRMKLSNSYLLFLFSADNVNDLFKRWQYLRQYDKYRKKQARLIAETKQTLETKAEQLEKRKKEKEQLLVSEEKQKQLLNQELKDKDQLLNTLKKDESRLAGDLKEQQNAHQKLNDVIESFIRDEMADRRRNSRTSEALEATKNLPDIDLANLSNDFQDNKGQLPWPVRSGVITRHFGTQPHPTIKSVEIVNNGIDIRSENQARVYAIFHGKVVGTQFVPGYQNMVIIQHGHYYTVYSNLEEVAVKRGDQIRARQFIGRLNNDNPEVHFEVWREKQRLNPVNWVAKAS